MKLDVMRPTHVVDSMRSKTPTSTDRVGARDCVSERWCAWRKRRTTSRSRATFQRSPSRFTLQQANRFATWRASAVMSCSAPGPLFRDVSYEQCNKRNPGSGLRGARWFNRSHACWARATSASLHPGDFAQALVALDATVEIGWPARHAQHPVCRAPPQACRCSHIETTLGPGEMLTAFFVPTAAWSRRSVFVKDSRS